MKSSKLLWFGIKEKDTCYIVVFKKYEITIAKPTCKQLLLHLIKKSLNRTENFQKRAFCFLLVDYTSSYVVLLKKSNELNMNLARERILCFEVYETLNNLNPYFIQKLFVLFYLLNVRN